MSVYHVMRYTGRGEEVSDYGHHHGGTSDLAAAVTAALADGGYHGAGAQDWARDVTERTTAGQTMRPATFYGRVVVEDA